MYSFPIKELRFITFHLFIIFPPVFVMLDKRGSCKSFKNVALWSFCNVCSHRHGANLFKRSWCWQWLKKYTSVARLYFFSTKSKKDKFGAKNPYIYYSMTSVLYRSGTVNSNTVNSKFHLIRSYCEIFFYHFPNISCLKCTVNSNFRLIRSKTLLTNDFELTIPNLYSFCYNFKK